jgi:hypothetical protein
MNTRRETWQGCFLQALYKFFMKALNIAATIVIGIDCEAHDSKREKGSQNVPPSLHLPAWVSPRPARVLPPPQARLLLPAFFGPDAACSAGPGGFDPHQQLTN